MLAVSSLISLAAAASSTSLAPSPLANGAFLVVGRVPLRESRRRRRPNASCEEGGRLRRIAHVGGGRWMDAIKRSRRWQDADTREARRSRIVGFAAAERILVVVAY